jgi:predicted DNA-binding transcriptional regulator AlpA
MTTDDSTPRPSIDNLASLPKLFSIPQLAEYFGVSARTVEGWNVRGTGPQPIRIGKHIRYTENSIREFLASRAAARS